MISFNISPIPIGRIHGFLSKGIKQHYIKEEIDSTSTRSSEDNCFAILAAAKLIRSEPNNFVPGFFSCHLPHLMAL